MATIAATTYLPIALVASVNRSHYGAALTNDVATGQFRRAYADWTRVRAGPLVYDIPVSRSQRYAVYAVSAAAAELAGTLESPANVWIGISCGGSPSPPCDYGGAFTVWALRDAAASAGYYSSERVAQAYFARLASEIETACAQHRLSCVDRLPAGFQPLRQTTLGRVGRYAGKLLHQALTSDVFTSLQTMAPKAILPATERADAQTVLTPFPANQAAADAQFRQFGSRDWPYRTLAAVYHPALLVMLLLAVIGCIAGFFRPDFPHRALSWLCLALIVGLLGRLAVLAIEATTEFDTTEARYGLVARALLVTLAAIGTAQLIEVAKTLLNRRRPTNRGHDMRR